MESSTLRFKSSLVSLSLRFSIHKTSTVVVNEFFLVFEIHSTNFTDVKNRH